MYKCLNVLFALVIVSLWPTAWSQETRADDSPKTWTQAAEAQPVMEQGADDPEESSAGRTNDKPRISEKEFNAGPRPDWIWGDDNDANYVLATSFEASDIVAARLMASCDNVGTVFVNNKQVATGTEWQEAMSADVSRLIVNGKNTITAQVENQGGVAAFVLKLAMKDSEGNVTHVVSDLDWTLRSKNLTNGQKVAGRGAYGDSPWGNVFSNVAAVTRIPRGTFEVLPGFQVEKLFTVPKDELGSWVCIAFDNKGRLLASDQGGKGICRITPAALDGSTETVVEHLDFSSCEFQPSGAQGMLWAFDSLYFCCNGGPGSGLYRARDNDGDDQFDECVRLKQFRGGGEHGPHSIRLSPDGSRIFVIAGNHTDPPFKAGEDLENDNYTSRIPTNWGEDLLLPRMWDANGHARGKLAPGGWIASTDPDGKTWDLWSIGYRNPYDMAFNADGELFAYDADMEWDVGTPWYRPTRVVHATSGSEFGWRSGTGKWPEYYMDSLPPLVDIGPGSPVGVDFGYGLHFPAKYQKAMYICDWTFGTMYAIHMEPNEFSYKGTKEEFVSRTPLPLTDCAAGPDGALYFTIGGRGTQSELYRVTYTGDESTAPAELHDEQFADHRKARGMIEKSHGKNLSIVELLTSAQEMKQMGLSLADFGQSADPFYWTAIRRAANGSELGPMLVEPLTTWHEKNKDTNQLFQLITMLARNLDRNGLDAVDVRSKSLSALSQVDFGSLDADQKLGFLRTLSLVLIRAASADESNSDAATLRDTLSLYYPADDNRVNRELCQVLVYLNDPTVVEKTVNLLNAPPQREDIDMGELLTRNAGYGRAIQAMIENQPDKQQVWYAFCLRVAKAGWTPELRADYYRWFGRAQEWSGGKQLPKIPAEH